MQVIKDLVVWGGVTGDFTNMYTNVYGTKVNIRSPGKIIVVDFKRVSYDWLRKTWT